MKLKDKVAIITGGARGIGKEIAKVFLEEGAEVAVCDISTQNLSTTEAELKNISQRVSSHEVDVTNLAKVEEVVNKILDKYGKIDILINNAGVTRDSLLVRMSEADWDLVVSVNLKGTFNFMKAVSKSMMKAHYGRIVNIASIIGLIGNPGQANYAASKAGIIGLTKSVAKELASRNVNVNAIAPGFIDTQMTQVLPKDTKKRMLDAVPLGYFGKPNDVARLALFLTSEDSKYITGQVIALDGGMVM